MRLRREGHHTLALPRQVRSARCWAVCERRTHTHSHSHARPCKTCVTRAPGPRLSWLTAHRHAPPPATQDPPLPSLAAKCCLFPRRLRGGWKSWCATRTRWWCGMLQELSRTCRQLGGPALRSPAYSQLPAPPPTPSFRMPSAVSPSTARSPPALPEAAPSRRPITGTGDAKGRRAAAHLCRGRSRDPAAIAPGAARSDRLPRRCAQDHASCAADTAGAALTPSARPHRRWGSGGAGGGGGAVAYGGQG